MVRKNGYKLKTMEIQNLQLARDWCHMPVVIIITEMYCCTVDP
jgi:hypothetical protein